MSPKKFWRLTFYEWSMWLLRIKAIRNKRKFDHELSIRLSRRMMAVTVKAAGGKNVREEDFWKLVEDNPEEGKDLNSPDLTDEELKERNDKIKALIARRKNG